MRKTTLNNTFTVIIMFSYFYDILMSFITLILGFFGIDMKKKAVSFADNVKEDSVPVEEQHPVESDDSV